MITEDDDDTHICLKCHTTIHGLDNYVNHRKSGCNNQPSSHTKPRILSPLIPPDEPDFSLKADDFFSLLELQSSSKKASLAVPSGGKTINSGVLTRSKATAVIQANNPNRASDWIGGHQLRELGNEDNQTKLINAVDNISGHIKKDDIQSGIVNFNDLEEDSNDDYEDDEEEFEDECNAPPRSHTGGKWKPSTSPIQWLRPSSHEYRNEWERQSPPPNYTGGKWKPMLPPQQFENDDEEDKNVPPPGHTKGKWIPGRNGDGSNNQQNLEDNPPLRKSSGTVQYWCGPCNRHLASKIVYDRHLKSELHFKRTLHEREFENTSDYFQQQKQSHVRAEGKRKIKKPENTWIEVEEKKTDLKKKRLRKHPSTRCEVCRSKVYNHQMGKHLISHYHCKKRNILKPVSQQMVLDNIHGIILQSPFQCSACRFYCNSESDFLNHWRSNDHKATSVKPKGCFSCGFCKFQSQDNHVIEEHLLSDNHREVVAVINRSVPIVIKKIVPIKCVSCTKQFHYNAELRKHCKIENHVMSNSSTDKYQDRHHCPDCNLLMKSNKSLQRHLLRRHNKNYFFCSTCSMIFETEMESKLHRKTQEHKYAVLKSLNKDVSKTCQYCYMQFTNLMHLKDHLRKKHPDHYFSCSKCGQKFTLSQEVSRHIKAKLCSFEATSNIAYFNCDKCPFKANSEADYLFHVALHNEPTSIYDISQQSSSKKPPVNQYKCPVCEKYFRKSSLRCHIRQHTNERPFKCQMCKAAYARKSNLMDHIKRQHPIGPEDENLFTGEFLQTREKRAEYTSDRRSEQSRNHVRLVNNVETEEDKIKTQQERTKETRDKKFLCAFCGKSFMKKFTLLQHIKTHTGKDCRCPLENCVYRGRTETELKIHLSTHSAIKSFKCEHCEHRTKTKAQLARHAKIHNANESKKNKCSFCTFSSRTFSHLKRHLRLHTGAKPFRCPHCLYTCNNLENLRKHILSTNKHPGKCIYKCNFCEEPDEYATNFAKDFRVHLITTHPDRFESSKEAASYIVGIYNAEEDSELMKTNLISNQTNNKSDEIIEATNETIANNSAVLFTSAVEEETRNPRNMDSELLSMVVVANPREDIIYVEMPSTGTENWTMEGYYDVEESGTLVPFHSDNSDLLNEDFDNETTH